jgi:hypothetical protein
LVAFSITSRSRVMELILENFSLGKILVDFISNLGKISVDLVGPFPILQNT